MPSSSLLFHLQEALESIDVIGEVDVAYTHDSDSDDYTYVVWFKARVTTVPLRVNHAYILGLLLALRPLFSVR